MKEKKQLFSQQLESAFSTARTFDKKKLFLPSAVCLVLINFSAQLFNFRGISWVPSLIILPILIMSVFHKKIRLTRQVDFFLCVQIFLTGLSFIAMMYVHPDMTGNFSLFSILILSVFFLFRLGYKTAAITGFLLIAAYAGVIASGERISGEKLWSNVFFLILLSGIGLTTCYMIEFYVKSILLKNLAIEDLEKEKQKDQKTKSVEMGRIHKSLELEMRAHIEAEAQLKESEQKYRNLVASLPEGILIVRDDRILFSNATIERLSGYDHYALKQIRFCDLLKQIDSKKEGNHKNRTLVRQDGVKIPIETHTVPIIYRQKPAVLVSIKDITEQVMAAREKTRLEQELLKARKMEALGLLAGGVAHDLNNVLSGLVSAPDVLLADLDADSELRGHVEMIKESGKRAAVIVEDLLTLARGSKATKEPVQLNYIIEDYLESPEFRHLMQENFEVDIKTSLDSEIEYIEGSGIQIRKMVMNLVSNAVEAIGRQKGEVGIETEWIRPGRSGRDVNETVKGKMGIRFTVWDSGKGISDDDIERIFEPFYSRKVMGRSGTGLGLSIVWNAVHDHDGQIEVQSCDGRTRFTVYLPVSEMSEAVAENTPTVLTMDDLRGQGEKILIVEDMETQKKITLNMLVRLGYVPTAVDSGEAAVEESRKCRFDLVILDMILETGMNGLETFKQLLLIDPEIKAIITSGYAITDEVVATQKLGAGPYIQKPFTLEQIGRAIKGELVFCGQGPHHFLGTDSVLSDAKEKAKVY